MSVWRYGQIAARLARLGYQPIPLYPDSKRPAVEGWPDYRYDQSQLDNRSAPRRVGERLVFPDYATGVVTGEVIGLDIDVRDAKIVRKIKALADRMLGPGPDRVGAAPKFLRVYRTGTPFKKIRRAFVLPGDKTRAKDYKPHAIEVLAEGQQFVCEAIHEKTRRPYRWSVPGGLLVTPVSSLTACTEAECCAFVSAAEALIRGSGGKLYAAKKQKTPQRAQVRAATASKIALPATLLRELRQELHKDAEAQNQSIARTSTRHDAAACRAALAAVPNHDEDYELWWRVGLACAHALGEAGRADFLAWSRKSKKHDQESKGYSDRAYTGFLRYCAEGRSQITAGSIFHLAREAGWKGKRCIRRPYYWQRPAVHVGAERL